MAHHPVTFAPAADLRADAGDLARKLHAGRHRGTGPVFPHVLDFAIVDARCADAHQHFVGAGLRRGDILHGQLAAIRAR
ncbi:hypothetical protein D3C81_1953210 [compost metagenome]